MTIEIKDWSYNSYLHMIEYLYTAQIDNFNHTIALEVLGIADAYSIDNLKSLCENTLIHNVSNENVATFIKEFVVKLPEGEILDFGAPTA